MRLIKPVFPIIFCFLLFASNIVSSQDKILNAFNNYSELPREVAYVHINKSIYIKGENIGYTAYILDKANNKPSIETTNLYCIISDSSNTVVKQQLVKVNNGIASGIIKIDSLFAGGDYTFTAFTNWMRNFSEKNQFNQSITIIDPEETEQIKAKNIALSVDAQFLPEGGHAVTGIETVFGVVIKNNLGFGIPNVEGEILDSKNQKVADFKLNHLGISRFILRPVQNENYNAVFQVNNKEYKFPIKGIKPFGLGIKIQDLKSNVGILISSSQNSSKNNYLTIHNGDSIKSLDINFKNTDSVLKLIPKVDLYPGVNVFTLFNEKGKPLLERLFFNYNGIDIVKLDTPKFKKNADSLEISISLKEKIQKQYGNLSVSILPKETKSYGAHHNFISSVQLTPYINGEIEQAQYYFKNSTSKKKYDLDNLLLTQGWSSYNWGAINSKKPTYLFDFEKGISYKTTINGNKAATYFQYPTSFHNSETFTIDHDKNTFSKDSFFPFDNEKLSLSQIGKKGALKKPGVFVQFKPAIIPRVNFKNQILKNENSVIFDSEIPQLSFESISDLQKLNEVVLLKQQTYTRVEKIRNRTNGNVDFFEADDYRKDQYLSTYLSQRGYVVNEEGGIFSLTVRNPSSPNNNIPQVYLDDILLSDLGTLFRYRLDIIDYIEINKSGVGAGLRGGAGIIKIYTDPFKRNVINRDNVSASYDIPLTFSKNKRYYTPLFNSYSSNFFKYYGAIDWYPSINIKGVEASKFKISNTELPAIKLFIEGLMSDGKFISETIDLEID